MITGSKHIIRGRAETGDDEQVLATGQQLLDRFAAIEGEAKWLAGELDQARDLDVFIQATMPADDEGMALEPALAAFGKRLLAAQARAYDRAVEALGSRRFADLLLDDYRRALAHLDRHAPATPLSEDEVASFHH